MTLKDISNGPDWIMWVAFVILALMSIVCFLQVVFAESCKIFL